MMYEVRMVPQWWEHPKFLNGQFKALHKFSDYRRDLDVWMTNLEERGLQAALDKSEPPRKQNYMPDWVEADCYMMYESSGIPVSPSFKTIEELAYWMDENNIRTAGGITANYEYWLEIIKQSIAPVPAWTQSAFNDYTAINMEVQQC